MPSAGRTWRARPDYGGSGWGKMLGDSCLQDPTWNKSSTSENAFVRRTSSFLPLDREGLAGVVHSAEEQRRPTLRPNRPRVILRVFSPHFRCQRHHASPIIYYIEYRVLIDETRVLRAAAPINNSLVLELDHFQRHRIYLEKMWTFSCHLYPPLI